MKRAVALMAIAGLGLAACGDDDDDAGATTDAPVAEPADEPADEPTDEPAGEPADEPAAEPASEPASEPDGGEDVSDGDDGDDATDDTSSGDPVIVRSLADVPDQCKDEMADFLRKIEPVVGSIDWQTATFADFETIGTEFDALSDEFDENSAISGCDALEFEGVDEFAVLLEFASDVAPGTVGFFQFIDAFAPADDGGGDGSAGDGETAGGAIETCDDAIAFVEGLMAEYDNFVDVPAAELVQFAQLGNVILTCTPEQQAFLDSDEVSAFLDG